MAELNIVSKNLLEISQSLNSLFDFVTKEKPIFIERSQDDILIISAKMLHNFFANLKFTISLFREEDGSFTGTLEELDLIENAQTKEDCLISVLKAMKEYAQDFYDEFSLWSSAPNRKGHIPYVLKILSSSDSQLMEDVICQTFL